jgi:V/A-type H+-transporting ATPase subunit C
MLASRLLPDERIKAFVEQTPGDSTEPADVGAMLGEGGGRAASLEQGILDQVLRDLRVIARPVWAQERDLLVYGIHWFEMANLKTLIRGKFSGQPDQVIRDQLVDVGPFATLPVDELLRTEDPAELLRRLEGTPYADIARQARRVYEEQKDLFAVDATMDRRFFAELQRRARGVALSQRGAVLEVLGSVLDRFNLSWLLRYRFSYNLPPAEAYYLLAPAGRRLSADRLLALAQLGSLQEVLDALPPAYKGPLAGSETVNDVDDRLTHMLRSVASEHLRDNRHPVARAFAYIVLREGEMLRLLAVVKGRRMGLSTELIRFAARLGD